MKALLQLAATLALVSIGVGVAVLSLDAHKFLLDAHKFLQDADATVRNVDAVTLEAQKQLRADDAQVATLLASIDAAAVEQRAYWQKTSADSDKTVKALRLTVDRAALLLKHTDEQLNGSLLPDVDGQFKLTAESAQASFASISRAGDALTFQIDDMQPIFANLDVAAKNVASGTGHADSILANGDKTAAYYEKRLTTPVSFAKSVAYTVLDVGAKVGSIFAGFVK